MEIRITNNSDKYVTRISNLQVTCINGMNSGLKRVGKEIVKRTQKNIRRSGRHGRTYYYNKTKYTASAYWEYSANRSGELANSMQRKMYSKKKMGVGASAKHAKYQELGTKNKEGKTLIKPRHNILRTISGTKTMQKKILSNEMKRFVENAHR